MEQVFSKRSLAWTGIVLFTVLVATQVFSNTQFVISVHDVPEATPEQQQQPNLEADAARYTRNYSTLWQYLVSLSVIYLVLAILSHQQPPAKGPWCRVRYILNYEVAILNANLSLATVIQVAGLALLNMIHLMRKRVIADQGGRSLFHQEYSNRAAQLAVCNMAVAVAFAAQGSTLWQWRDRRLFDQPMSWHAWFARFAGVFALYHGCYQLLRNYPRQGYDFLLTIGSNVRYATGTGMLIAAATLVLFSHPLVRTYSYRLFRISHIASFFGLVLLGCWHHWAFTVFYVTMLFVWCVDQWHHRAIPAKVIQLRSLPGRVSQLVIETTYSIATTVRPGQFVFVSFSDSWWKSRLDSHPFSICRAQRVETSESSASVILTFYVKASGRSTSALYELARSSLETEKIHTMRVSVPIGNPSVDRSGRGYGDFPVVVLVAEGIGITPWIAVLHDLSQCKTRPVEVIVFWSVRDYDMLESFLPEFQDSLSQVCGSNLHVFLTRRQDSDIEDPLLSPMGGVQITKGRPNYATLLEDVRVRHPSTDVVLGICAHNETIRLCSNVARSARYSNGQSMWTLRCERFEF